MAAAGIGTPDRFFAMLAASGLAIHELPLADHFDFSSNPFEGLAADRVLITEKDAVKCRRIAALHDDPRVWVVSLEATVDAELVELIITHLNLRGSSNGPPAP